MVLRWKVGPSAVHKMGVLGKFGVVWTNGADEGWGVGEGGV